MHVKTESAITETHAMLEQSFFFLSVITNTAATDRTARTARFARINIFEGETSPSMNVSVASIEP